MSIGNRRATLITAAVCALVLLPFVAWAQTASVFNYPGGGVIQAGDLWESFLPAGVANTLTGGSVNYSEAATYSTLGVRTFVRLGNFDRQWTTPGTHWPSAYPYTPFWYKNLLMFAYDTSATFNPATIGGAANPSYFAGSRNTANQYSEFAQFTYKHTLQGASDATRRYYVEPYWVDGVRRQHSVYEAAWPTNLGIDVKMRAHGFQGPNWNNLNDFVVVEIELKNTGVLDMNMDGVAEKVNNDIQALAMQYSTESYMSISSYAGGGRNNNDIVPSPTARQACWIDDLDETGAPWAFGFMRTAPSTGTFASPPTAGNWNHGFNGGNSKNYTDIYTGWVMLDAKIGGLPANRAQSTGSQPTKYTTFGTHPIGVGPQRGWYVSGGSQRQTPSLIEPRLMFYVSTGAFYVDAGKNHATDRNLYNYGPNTNVFASGNAGDPLSFVPKAPAAWTRPNGDLKSTGQFDQVSTEDGTGYPTGYGKFSVGASHTENFDGDAFAGIGPFSLKKDSVITLVFATVAGYRMEGIQKAVRAARWAYANNYAVPVLPSMPDVKVSNTLQKSVAVSWNNVAETDAEFAGYKIWRAAQLKQLNWLDEGMRVVDLYQEQMTVGTRPTALYKPVNPKFDAFALTQSTATKGKYQPDTWGTWDLVAVVPRANLSQYASTAYPGYQYVYYDANVILGFTYYYYVSAYKEGSYTGPGGETTTRIETHYTNRNGATGLWNLTWPFAYNNVNFPKDATGLKNIGAALVVGSALAPKGDVSNVGVRPNPYKKAALHDKITQVYDHKLMFYNLPPEAKITILDVSGQVIDVINFASSDPTKGWIFWDMFSKDGIEVASGLYVYMVESASGNKVGYFSILR